MLRSQYTTHIAAPPVAVWGVLMDVQRWPEWTPTMRRVERLDDGAFGAGSRARITLRGMPPGVWRVSQFTGGSSFTWQTETGLRISAMHTLEAEDAGTRLTLATEASGLLAVAFAPLVLWLSRRNLRREAHGLKRHCEALEPA
ncbi:MAG TPA: SRPBCC family protein [Dehalococcoidia bacterium]|nr:SRPBCC family protein [Dehalococcoidia bacterium]